MAMTSEQIQYVKSYISDLKPSLLGKFTYYCAPYRKRIIRNNMQLVFAEHLSAAEINKLAKGFYSHLLKSIKENIIMRFMSMNAIANKGVVLGYEKVLAAANQKKGIMILTGHFGNWEFTPFACILNFKQFQGRFHIIRKRLSNKFFEKLLFRRYNKVGIQVIPKDKAMDPICNAIEAKDAVVFVMDQHANLEVKDGIAVEFFGKPAGTYRSLAMLASYTEAPVFPVACYRRKDGKHVLEFLDQVTWQAEGGGKQQLYDNTRAYNQALENIILTRPDQWLWSHRRWKL